MIAAVVVRLEEELPTVQGVADEPRLVFVGCQVVFDAINSALMKGTQGLCAGNGGSLRT